MTRLRDQQAREDRIRWRSESAMKELNDLKARFETNNQEMNFKDFETLGENSHFSVPKFDF
jgi:hypothetical protein